MNSWYYQADNCYGQLDARDEANAKELIRRLPGDRIKGRLEVWEAIPGGRQPSLPRVGGGER